MTQPSANGKQWQTVAALVFSVLGFFYFLFQAAALVIFWAAAFFVPQSEMMQAISLGLLIWSSLLSAVMLFPVFCLSLYKMRGQAIPAWLDTKRPIVRKVALWLILLWPLVVFLGWLVAGIPAIAAFVLGPLNVLVAGLPVLWIYTTAKGHLNGGSQERQWRIFGFSLTIMPMIVIIVELVAILILAAIFGVWMAYRISVNPQLETQMMDVLNQLMGSGTKDMDAVFLQFKSVILQPVVIFWALAIFAGIMPMIEEIVKPVALWAVAGRRPSPQEGFVSGLLCGAGFALMENVLYFTTILTQGDWLYMAIGRAGTGVLHMLASGLVGWGLARMWRDGRWVFQALTLMGAIGLHGLWNALALATGLAPLFLLESEPTIWQTLLINSPVIILLVVSLIGVFLINRYLRRDPQEARILSLNSADEEQNTAEA